MAAFKIDRHVTTSLASGAFSFGTAIDLGFNFNLSAQLVWGLQTPDFTVRLATAAALPACTAAGTGVGHTLTGNANGALTVDGVLTVAADRVLVKNQVAGSDNGIYVVTQVGTAGTPFILTRATDFDAASASEIRSGALVVSTAGVANTNKQWELTTADPIVVDTTALTFAAGEPVGTWSFQGSNNSTNGVDGTWPTITEGLTISVNPAGSAGDHLVDLTAQPWKYIRPAYTRTSGRGAVDIYICGKQT